MLNHDFSISNANLPVVAVAYCVMLLLWLQILISIKSKSERGTYLFLLAEIPALAARDVGEIVTYLSLAAGCAVAAYVRPPLWLWRIGGSRASLFLAGGITTAVAGTLLTIVPANKIMPAAEFFAMGGAASALYIFGDQFAGHIRSACLSCGLAGALAAGILGQGDPVLLFAGVTLLGRTMFKSVTEWRENREAKYIKDEHIVLTPEELSEL